MDISATTILQYYCFEKSRCYIYFFSFIRTHFKRRIENTLQLSERKKRNNPVADKTVKSDDRYLYIIYTVNKTSAVYIAAGPEVKNNTLQMLRFPAHLHLGLDGMAHTWQRIGFWKFWPLSNGRNKHKLMDMNTQTVAVAESWINVYTYTMIFILGFVF